MSDSFDAIIIGSGIGGLTCGAFLARAGMRVGVLERHTRIGGYAHTWRRRKYVFDSGIHSVPAGEGGALRSALNELGIDDRVEFVDHSSMARIVSPSCRERIPSLPGDIREYLYSHHPACRSELDALYRDAHYAMDTVREVDFDFEDGFGVDHAEFAARFHGRPFADYLADRSDSPALRKLFSCLWPYAGMSPDVGATMYSFMVFVAHALEGSQYCRGGFDRLAEALAGVITESGGAVLTRAEVATLHTEERQVRAAVTTTGDTYEAHTFVSNVSPHILHGSLLPEGSRSRRWLRRIGNLNPSLSVTGVYLGLTPAAASLVRDGVTLWLSEDDHAAVYRRAREGDILGDHHLVALRGTGETEYPTLLLMKFCAQDGSQNWHEDKMRVAEQVLTRAEKLFPGLRDGIEVMEVGSPDTYQRYTGNAQGAIYGYENTADLYGEARMPSRTHLHNLYQTGHYQRPGSGVWNVSMNGRVVAKRILKAT